MSEEIVTFGSSRTLVGVHHRPDVRRPGVPGVLLLNAGILHRVGPNRLYVNIARDLERRGFDVLRFDVFGIGDSQDLHDAQEAKTFFDDTMEAMELLRQRTGTARFMLMGICMGAKIALDVASRDSRVESLVLMEGIYVKSPRYYVARALDPDKWKRLVTGDSHFVRQLRGRIAKKLGSANGNGKSSGNGNGQKPAAAGTQTRPVLLLSETNEKEMRRKLDAVLDRGTKVMLLFRDGNEIAYNYRLRRRGDAIVAAGLPRGLDVAFVPFADHTFTPLLSQELLLGATMQWIDGAHAVQ